jgi:hypothetical protein
MPGEAEVVIVVGGPGRYGCCLPAVPSPGRLRIPVALGGGLFVTGDPGRARFLPSCQQYGLSGKDPRRRYRRWR